MTKTDEPAMLDVHVQRKINLSKEAAFELWCDKAHLEKWFRPSPDVSLTVAELDVRAGGQFRFTYTRSDGGVELETRGEFREVEPPDRLVFSWIWSAHMPFAGHETEITVTFEDDDGGVLVSLTHRYLPNTEMQERHAFGWANTLEALASYA